MSSQRLALIRDLSCWLRQNVIRRSLTLESSLNEHACSDR